MAPPKKPPKVATAKAASTKKDASKRDAKKDKQSDRTMQIVGAVSVGFVALLVGSTHLLKRARRARKARLASMTDEERAAEAAAEATRWVVSERAMVLVAGGLLLLGIALVIGVVYGQRLRDKYAAMRAAQRERSERRELAALKDKERTQGQAARSAARAAARKRRAEETAAQEAFEANLLAEIQRMRDANREEEALAAQQRLEQAQAAYQEAARIDEMTRMAARAGGGGAGSLDDDDWDVGEWESADAYEDGGGDGDGEAEDGSGDGGGEVAAEDEEEDDEEDDEAAPKMDVELTPVARGTRVALEGVNAAPEQTARVDSLWVQLGCMRCGTPTELVLSGLRAREAEAKAWCEKCASVLSAALRPTLQHAEAPLLGHIDSSNCTVVDVPRLVLLAQCGQCGADCALPELQRGRRSQMGCFSCHAPVWLQASNFAVERLAGGSAGGARRGGVAGGDDDDDEMEQLLKRLRKKNSDQLKSLGLSVGKPLPNKGACSHYKHSYRWLRFPCCGRAYPCAVCHQQSDCPAAEMGAWANRMICGKCSREMPYSDKPCEHCGNTFTKPGGAHWQGGDGCRDQRRLDSKDSRKFKGASVDGVKKMTSQKNHRVGALGKANTTAKKLSQAKPS